MRRADTILSHLTMEKTHYKDMRWGGAMDQNLHTDQSSKKWLLCALKTVVTFGSTSEIMNLIEYSRHNTLCIIDGGKGVNKDEDSNGMDLAHWGHFGG